MASEPELSGLTDLLHSSTRILEQAAPSNQFPPLQRNLEQLEALSRKLKSKAFRSEDTSKSITATRLLAREGLNAEQLARDLRSFDLKSNYEDVFPSEATTVEEYMQQVHEIAMISAIQEAQKDNLQRYSDYIMQVFEDDWNNEKKDFLQSLSKISMLPKRNTLQRTGSASLGQVPSPASSRHASSAPYAMEVAPPLSSNPIIEKKASVYAEMLSGLNEARGRGLPFKPAAAFRGAYETLGLDTSGTKTVTMQKVWHLVQTLVGEDLVSHKSISRKMLLVMGARRHLEWGHEKYIIDTIQSHPAQAALGGAVGNLHKVRAFLRVRMRDHGLLDFDAGDARRQPPVDTTWQQIYYCLRTGYVEEARNVAQSSRVAHQFASQLSEWITNGGLVSQETASAASEECEKLLRTVDRLGRTGYDRKKLLLYAIISGSRRQIERLIRDMPSLFNAIEDFLWFMLSSIRDCPSGSSVVLSEGSIPYCLEDLQGYLNKFESSYYTKNGKDPLVYPYVLLLSVQLLPAITHLSKESGGEGYNVDSVHISIVFADHGVLSDGSVISHKNGLLDACAEAASIIRQYGFAYLRHGNLSLALEYYVQAAAAIGGGQISWLGRGNVDQQRQRNVMLKQLLVDILLSEGGISLLLGPSGAGEDGELKKYLMDWKSQQQFLLKAANQCQESGLYEKSVEIHKRIGAFASALETINKCLSDAICSMTRGRFDGESQTAGLVHSGNDILEASKYSPEVSFQEKANFSDQQTLLRQLEAILFVQKLARAGKHVDALREVVKLPFLPLNPRSSDVTDDPFGSLSTHVQSCVPDLLKSALNCLDHVADSDCMLRALKSKISSFVANNMTRNWPHDLYEKVARSL